MRQVLTLRPTRNPVLDDPNVGASDVCMDCRNDLAAFTTGWQLCEVCRGIRVRQQTIHLNNDPNDTSYGAALIHLVDRDLWTLGEYLAWMAARDEDRRAEGWWVAGLTPDLNHWAAFGIKKASELGAYLDAEVEKEIRKDLAA